MGLHKIGLDLHMAGSADGLVKFDEIAYVAGCTCKRRAIRLLLVSSQ